jgi:uncharacterized protein (DUF111 family)
VLTTVAAAFGPVPAMQVSAVGYGAGSRDGGPLPNVLRVLLGEQAQDGSSDAVVELSANLDNCTGEVLGSAMETLLEAGALDAWATPITMKKSRPAWMLSVLCAPADAGSMEAIIFAATPTLGVRRQLCARRKLHRRHVTVQTPYGPIRVKVGWLDDPERPGTASPEYEDCAAAGRAHGVAVREVIAAALQAYRAGR